MKPSKRREERAAKDAAQHEQGQGDGAAARQGSRRAADPSPAESAGAKKQKPPTAPPSSSPVGASQKQPQNRQTLNHAEVPGNNWARLKAELTKASERRNKGKPSLPANQSNRAKGGPPIRVPRSRAERAQGGAPGFAGAQGGEPPPRQQGGAVEAPGAEGLPRGEEFLRGAHRGREDAGASPSLRAAPRDAAKRDGVSGRHVAQGNLIAAEGDPARATKLVAMDCEMVGVGREGRRSILARVSLVNSRGEVLLDKFVRPLEKVKDYRTPVSGVRRSDLAYGAAEDFWVVQKQVASLIKGRILVGHALRNDLKALLLSHPRHRIRDTQKYKPYRGAQGQARSLKALALETLGRTIQSGEHDSVEDARSALALYARAKPAWEKALREKMTNAKQKKASHGD